MKKTLPKTDSAITVLTYTFQLLTGLPSGQNTLP